MNATDNRIVERFWRSMAERFGRRWLEEYGDTPTRAWADELAPWPADTVKTALAMMGQRAWVHPPTLPQFQQLLRDADRAPTKSSEDFVRGFWRTVIVQEAAQAVGLPVGKFETFLAARAATLGAGLRQLLNDADSREKARNERSPAAIRFVQSRAWELARASLRDQDDVAA